MQVLTPSEYRRALESISQDARKVNIDQLQKIYLFGTLIPMCKKTEK